jgi:hypothetical protein
MIMEGDDVAMLQHFMWTIGLSEKARPGVKGTPVTRDGKFSAETKTAVERFQRRDEIGVNGRVGDGTLGKIVLHWGDYVKAYEGYHDQDGSGDDKYITTTHPLFTNWADEAARFIQSAGLYPQSVLGVPGKTVIYSWVNKETGNLGHWGYSGWAYRLTLSSGRLFNGNWDETGSIGFSQIQNRFRYGNNLSQALINLNLYSPRDGVMGFVVWSASASLGGGLYRAFDPASGTGSIPRFQVTETFGGYPRLGPSFTDDALDLLAKGVRAYKSGAYAASLSQWTMATTLKEVSPGAVLSIEYALAILSSSGFSRAYQWEDAAITAGPDGICNTVLTAPDDPVDMLPGAPYHVCLVASSGSAIRSVTSGDDQVAKFLFDFSWADYLGGTAWQDKRRVAIPAVIPPPKVR